MHAPETRKPIAPRITARFQGAAANAGLRLVHLHQWRVLPDQYRNRMAMQLHELGWTMEEIALFSGINAHRTTIARAIRAGRSARDHW